MPNASVPVAGEVIPFAALSAIARDDIPEHAPPAHRSWGPDFWPEAVRENITNWPPHFRERQLIGEIRVPIATPRCIAVMSGKPGMGKTLTARMLQSIFSAYRNERVAVLDADVHGTGPHDGYVHAIGKAVVSRQRDRVGAAVGGGRESARSQTSAATAVRREEEEVDYRELLSLLTQHYPVVLCEIGEDLDEGTKRGILEQCNQLIVVTTPALDGLYAAGSVLDGLVKDGFGHLIPGSVLALNQIKRMCFSKLLRVDRHFAHRCRAVVRIPRDPNGEAAATSNPDELKSSTRTGFVELAAAVAAGFADQ